MVFDERGQLLERRPQAGIMVGLADAVRTLSTVIVTLVPSGAVSKDQVIVISSAKAGRST